MHYSLRLSVDREINRISMQKNKLKGKEQGQINLSVQSRIADSEVSLPGQFIPQPFDYAGMNGFHPWLPLGW
jgi:hypothetical protein